MHILPVVRVRVVHIFSFLSRVSIVQFEFGFDFLPLLDRPHDVEINLMMRFLLFFFQNDTHAFGGGKDDFPTPPTLARARVSIRTNRGGGGGVSFFSVSLLSPYFLIRLEFVLFLNHTF